MSSEMVERIGKALRNFHQDSCYPSALPGEIDIGVRAVLEAMREPTEAMVAASNREWDGRMSHRSTCAYQAMIDAALQESSHVR